jgi:N-acetylmuramoyl-L-alanine amidase
MSFQKKFEIVPQYLTAGSKRRSGLHLQKVKFIVVHDTGNPGSTAQGNATYYERSRDEIKASAHLFVDDKGILECVPALTSTPEKAWHVLYNVDEDDRMFGVDANDAAIGIEYCYGKSIDADAAYAKFVWLIAYTCYTFTLDPQRSIVGHCFLDPQRKTDPVTGLLHSRRTYDQLLKDIVIEYEACADGSVVNPVQAAAPSVGLVRATMKMNIRAAQPTRRSPVAQVVPAGTELSYTAMVEGELINNNSRWFKTAGGNFFWSGGVVHV